MASALLDFFSRSRRDLPWRHSRDPYRVWVSEIMLQQTRVETVRPYYQRWVAQFPDLQTLAAAPIDDVLKAWEGLGYYSRARNLHRAALLVRERYQGNVPDTIEALRALPGIGDYTAGAIASIAYGIPAPAVDGNVKRVLCRLLAVPRLSTRACQEEAQRLVSPQRPGDFNQAFMELGSTICTPRSPRCDVCPVQSHCAAFARGTQSRHPAPGKPAQVPEKQFVTILLSDAEERVLLRKRPDTGLLAGLWEFPDCAAGHADEIAAAKLARKLTGSRARPAFTTTVSHTFSHFRAHYHVFRLQLARSAPTPLDPALRWVSREELASLALPRAQRRIAHTCNAHAEHPT